MEFQVETRLAAFTADLALERSRDVVLVAHSHRLLGCCLCFIFSLDLPQPRDEPAFEFLPLLGFGVRVKVFVDFSLVCKALVTDPAAPAL